MLVPNTVGWPIVVMPAPLIMLGKGTYLVSIVVATGLSRVTGIRLPGKGSRRICGFVALTGFAELKVGFGRALSGLKTCDPASLKSPASSAAVGTVSVIVCIIVWRKPS